MFWIFSVQELVSIDRMYVARIYHSDGRLRKKVKLDLQFDHLFYCINEDEFVAWTQWKRELHVFTADLEILSTSMCDYTIGDFAYNETTSDVFTCGRGAVTVSSLLPPPERCLTLLLLGLAISLQSQAFTTEIRLSRWNQDRFRVQLTRCRAKQ